MKIADRVKRLPQYLTGRISARAHELALIGKLVADHSLGDPEMESPEAVKAALIADLKKPGSHRYQHPCGTCELRSKIAERYGRLYEVEFDSEQQVAVWPGSKPALEHLFFSLVEDGDVVLSPNPGYPIHTNGVLLAGGKVEHYRVEPDLDHWSEINDALQRPGVRKKTVGIVLNFPNNPTTATEDLEFYRKVVDLAKNLGIWIISDMAYAALGLDGKPVPSIFEADRAAEVSVEVGSLSKELSMQGWRVGWTIGNSEIMRAFSNLTKQVSYGMFRPIQAAALTALQQCNKDAKETSKIYKYRARFLVEQLKEIGWTVPMPSATMFVWAPLPPGHTDSMKFAIDLLETFGVAVTPGIGFGSNGEGHVRFSLTESDKKVERAVAAIGKFLAEG